jgi:hypothetical protein
MERCNSEKREWMTTILNAQSRLKNTKGFMRSGVSFFFAAYLVVFTSFATRNVATGRKKDGLYFESTCARSDTWNVS